MAMQQPYAQDNTSLVLGGGGKEGRGGEGIGREILTHLPLRQVAMSVASNLVSHSAVWRFRVYKRPELADITKSDVWLTVHRNSVWIRKTN